MGAASVRRPTPRTTAPPHTPPWRTPPPRLSVPRCGGGTDGDQVWGVHEVCTAWNTFQDPESGVEEPLQWILWRRNLDEEDEVVVTKALGSGAAGATCVNLTTLGARLEHGARYYSKFEIRHLARPPITTRVQTPGFRVDHTPPTGGRARMSMVLPPGLDSQVGFPHNATGLRLRMTAAGFADRETGVALLIRLHICCNHLGLVSIIDILKYFGWQNRVTTRTSTRTPSGYARSACRPWASGARSGFVRKMPPSHTLVRCGRWTRSLCVTSRGTSAPSST